MNHGYEVGEAGLELARPERVAPGHPIVFRLDRAIKLVNRVVMVPCMLAIVMAAGILSYSVAARYFFKVPTEWQDETAVFLLIGATFFSGAYVQSFRGHVGVEAIAGVLSARANHWRMLFADTLSLLFCAFFSWKSWTLLLEAYHEGYTSNSTWGPPLWIPYALMAGGMSLLALQLAVHLLARAVNQGEGK